MKNPPAKKPKNTKTPQSVKAKASPKEIEIELEPGMWGKFEGLIRRAAKMALQIEMKRRDLSCRDLTEMLNRLQINENERNLRNKIARRKFSASFTVICLMAMGVKALILERGRGLSRQPQGRFDAKIEGDQLFASVRLSE